MCLISNALWKKKENKKINRDTTDNDKFQDFSICTNLIKKNQNNQAKKQTEIYYMGQIILRCGI